MSRQVPYGRHALSLLACARAPATQHVADLNALPACVYFQMLEVGDAEITTVDVWDAGGPPWKKATERERWEVVTEQVTRTS